MRDTISDSDLYVDHDLTIAGICLRVVVRWDDAPDEWDVTSVEICDESHSPYSDIIEAGHPLFGAFRGMIIQSPDAVFEILESMPEPIAIAAWEEQQAERAALMSERI
jgi:hypothetical protein